MTLIKAHTRLLLQESTDDEYTSPSSMIRRPTSVDPRPPHFDTSMTLTVVVLLTALFFLAFFSVYIRRFAATDPPPEEEARKEGAHVSSGNSLPLLAYGRAAEHGMIISDDCPICLTRFAESEDVKVVACCGHVFHPLCIDTWLRTRMTCPLCRSARLFGGNKETRLHVRDTWRDEVVGRREITC